MKISSVRKLLMILSLMAAVPASATPNTPEQNQLNEVNRRTEFKIARDDCATQLGIVMPPSPHATKKLDPAQQTKMLACLSQKGFVKKQIPQSQKRTVSGQ